ncbi:MAG: cytochrome P450, partial [Streptosporangiaceae bacterium]
VITEALRLYSPVWILPRRALVDVELGGHVLRAGSRIFFSPYALNRDARLHHDPDRFEPDRWATDYSRSDMRATFFPFGQGIRNCIGEGFAWTESTLLLSAIAARWQLRLADGTAVHPVVSSSGAERTTDHRDPPSLAGGTGAALTARRGGRARNGS